MKSFCLYVLLLASMTGCAAVQRKPTKFPDTTVSFAERMDFFHGNEIIIHEKSKIFSVADKEHPLSELDTYLNDVEWRQPPAVIVCDGIIDILGFVTGTLMAGFSAGGLGKNTTAGWSPEFLFCVGIGAMGFSTYSFMSLFPSLEKRVRDYNKNLSQELGFH